MRTIPARADLVSLGISAIDRLLSNERCSAKDLFGGELKKFRRFLYRLTTEGGVACHGFGLQRRYYQLSNASVLKQFKSILLIEDLQTKEKGFGRSFVMTPELKSHLDGALLGDGHYSKLISGGLSCCFQIVQRHDHFDFIESIKNVLDRHGISSTVSRHGEKTSVIKKTGQIVRGEASLQLRTACYWNLKQERLRWYPEGKKIIPRDLDVSDPILLAYWYMGDGTTEKESMAISIATHCFSEDDQQWLVDQFDMKLSLKVKIQRSGIYQYLKMSMGHAERFLDLVRPHLVPTFAYKGVKVWNPVLCIKCGSQIENRTGHAKYCDQCCSPRESKERFLRNFEDPVRYNMTEKVMS